MKEDGFILIISMMVAVLLSALAGLAFFQVHQQWNWTTDLESQLHSHVLAENGVEYAKHILPYLEIEELLAGSDGVPCDAPGPGWRNPISLDAARRADPMSLVPTCDDGILAAPLLSPGEPEQGSFLIRFSNNPEEGPVEDVDRIVIARSLGIVPQKVSTVFIPEIRNFVTLLEVRLRQELHFLLPSALVVFGDNGTFTFEGTDFLIDGVSQCAISVVGLSGSGLMDDLWAAISTEQLGSIRSGTEEASVEDGKLYYGSAETAPLFEVSFWRHFMNHLPDFADPFPDFEQPAGLYFLPEGGLLEGAYRGLVIARGDLTLMRNARVFGLLVHLGDGQLKITDETQVEGGVWISNLNHQGDQLASDEILFELSGFSRIIYDPQNIRLALRTLPATQLEWRMIFPEMNTE